MIDFDAMSAKQAKQYLADWVATTGERRQWLQEAMTADGTGSLRDDVQSLAEVGRWLGSRTQLRAGVELGGRMPDLSGVQADQVPSWFDGTPAGAWMFDDWSNWAIDAAALNFAQVVRELDPRITWKVARERVRGYIDQNRPCLRSPDGVVLLNPIAVHVGALLAMHTRGTPPEVTIAECAASLGLG